MKIGVVLLSVVLISVNAQTDRQKIDAVNAMTYDYIVNNLQPSIDSLEQNVAAARIIGYRFGEAQGLSKLSVAYNLLGDFEKNTASSLRAIQILEDLDSLSHLASIYGLYGYQLRKRDLGKARQYMRRGIHLAEQIEALRSLAGMYDNYGVICEQQENFDSAMVYYQKSLDIKYELKDSVGIPFSLNNLAGIYAMQGNYDKAFEYLELSDEYRKQEEGDFGRAFNLVLYGEIYGLMDQPDSSLKYLEKCLRNAIENNYKDLTRYCYLKISELYETKHDFKKALKNHKKYVAYKDSILNISTNEKIARLEIAYETEKKDRQIAEKELALRQKSSQLILAVSFIVVLTAFSIGLFRFHTLKRNNIRRELELKNSLNEIELKNKMSDEKLRIARELHDNIGSHLTFMISSLDNLTYQADNKDNDTLYRLSTFGRNTLRELRNSIWAMQQTDGSLDKLVLRLNEFKRQLPDNNQGPTIEIFNRIRQPMKLNSLQMLNLYRVAQEAIQNAVKHANASLVKIIFEKSDFGFLMRVSDDGKGFDIDTVDKGEGLQNIIYRCKKAQGEGRIVSGKNGTVIECRIQLEARQE